MSDIGEADPFGTLISIITLREHEIGKLRKRIDELKNRLSNIKHDIEVEKRKELEILEKASDNLKRESELRSRIASLNASIDLADKLKSQNMRRIEKEKLELDEMKMRHKIILEEKRCLWEKNKVIYESLMGAEELRKEKCVLKVLQFTLMMKKAEIQQFCKEEAQLKDTQENMIFKLCSKIEVAERESSDLVSQIQDQEKKNRLNREEIGKLKEELEKMRSHLPVNSQSRLSHPVVAKASNRASLEKASIDQPTNKKMREESVNKCDSLSSVPNEAVGLSTFKRILTNPFQQIGNFSSSLFSFASLENMNFVRPRKRIEEVGESTKRLMMQLEESKKAIIESRQSELSQHSTEARASSRNSKSDQVLKRNLEVDNTNGILEKRSNNSQAGSEKSNNCEVGAQPELMPPPPPALVSPQMHDTAYFSQAQTQSDCGYQTQTQSSFGGTQNDPEPHAMYPPQNSQASAMDYKKDNRSAKKLPTQEDKRVQFNVKLEPMELSQMMMQPKEPTYNTNQKTISKCGEANQFNFSSPQDHEEAAAQKDTAYNSNSIFNQQNRSENNQTKSSIEQTPMEITQHANGEGSHVVESEYFSSKKYGQPMTFERCQEKYNSYEQMECDDRIRSPDMSFMMSPICSPMPEGLISPSPPPPPSTDNIGNNSGFGFQMSNEKKSGGFSFGSNKPQASSGGAIFKMF
ncbi:probable ubiquitin thioesterase DG1039 [Nilaparvata lugens]|uniref:probable ubiquitin thioesterase DG1039 n=1 Tax=Nilaparvata lugens TaxID=108931 RepID=UPI00193E0802|nr:probable ubiquitin thioesterase DG1039 [Nilaparvata lugens]